MAMRTQAPPSPTWSRLHSQPARLPTSTSGPRAPRKGAYCPQRPVRRGANVQGRHPLTLCLLHRLWRRQGRDRRPETPARPRRDVRRAVAPQPPDPPHPGHGDQPLHPARPRRGPLPPHAGPQPDPPHGGAGKHQDPRHRRQRPQDHGPRTVHRPATWASQALPGDNPTFLAPIANAPNPPAPPLRYHDCFRPLLQMRCRTCIDLLSAPLCRPCYERGQWLWALSERPKGSERGSDRSENFAPRLGPLPRRPAHPYSHPERRRLRLGSGLGGFLEVASLDSSEESTFASWSVSNQQIFLVFWWTAAAQWTPTGFPGEKARRLRTAALSPVYGFGPGGTMQWEAHSAPSCRSV